MTERITGKGLGSLIPNRSAQKSPTAVKPVVKPATKVTATEAVHQVSPQDIDANPLQPRDSIDHVSLDDLINSIRQHGILQPLVVSPQGKRYELVAGERRLQAAKILGLKKIPALVRNPNQQQKLELALVENIQRKNLNPLEKARGYRRLMDDFNLTQQEVSNRVGKNRVSIAQSLRLLTLPKEIQNSLAQGDITEGHGKVLLSILDQKSQLKAWREIVKNGLTIRDSEKIKITDKRTVRRGPLDPTIVDSEEELQSALGTRVRIKGRGQKGSIVIEFFSKEERAALIKKIIK